MSNVKALFLAMEHEALLPVAYLGDALPDGTLMYEKYADAVAVLPSLQPVPAPGVTEPVEPVDTSLLVVEIDEASIAELVGTGALEVCDIGYRCLDGAAVRAAVGRKLVERRPSTTVTMRTTVYTALAGEDVSGDAAKGRVAQEGAWSQADSMSRRETSYFKRKLRLFATRQLALGSLGKLEEDAEVALVELAVPNHRFERAIKGCRANKQRGFEMDERVSVLLAEHALVAFELVSGDGLNG